MLLQRPRDKTQIKPDFLIYLLDWFICFTQDYPSISQLSGKMQENGILPIFAIGKEPADKADPIVYYSVSSKQ